MFAQLQLSWDESSQGAQCTQKGIDNGTYMLLVYGA